MLQGVVDLATEATGCHACFIYLLEEGQLTIRAASPVFGEAVGHVRFSVQEGLTGWVARHRTPEFIRDQAMDDPRMKYVPLLQEERFQSMAAVPILSRAGETIGVIVLHTKAPHEFGRRVDLLTGLSELTQQVAATSGTAELGPVLVRGMARLLDADVCQLLRLQADGETLSLLASVPEMLAPPATLSAAELTLAAIEDRGIRPAARALWPSLNVGDLLVTPVAAGERVGLMCAASTSEGVFGDEDAEIARAIAHLAAVGRLEKRERLDLP